MGNNLKKEESCFEKENLILQEKRIIEFLGEKHYYIDPTQKKSFIYLKTCFNITNKNLTETQIQNLNCLNEIQNSTKLISYKYKIKKKFCNEKLTINFFFQTEKKNLFIISKKAQNKKESLKTNFSESDIWLIIGDLLNYINDLNYFQISNGDLQPKYIYMDENNVIKVFSPLLYTNFKNAYRFMLFNEKYKSPLSPELMRFFDFREAFPKYDVLKSDIFSFGICILCLIWGVDFESFYDFDKCEIKFELVFCYVKKLEQFYSEGVSLFLKLCLERDVEERASLDVLFGIMNKCCKSLIFWKN